MFERVAADGRRDTEFQTVEIWVVWTPLWSGTLAPWPILRWNAKSSMNVPSAFSKLENGISKTELIMNMKSASPTVYSQPIHSAITYSSVHLLCTKSALLFN